MSNYIEDYRMSSPQEKLDTLSVIYNMSSTTKEEKILISIEAQKQYNILRGRMLNQKEQQFGHDKEHR